MAERPTDERDRDIEAALGAWFDANARDLPWRRTRDPYAIWVSEIMLQQTRVDTVVPYFEGFMQRYPTVGDLAEADVDGVLSMWSGLGYYRRARELCVTARDVVDSHGGALPSEAADLRKLRGIGAYTAGAIASIAYGKVEPLVDGNVARVLARIEGIRDDVRTPAGSKRIWEVARRLVPSSRPGRFNESLMELGATVCTPREPRCAACPVNGVCVAALEGLQAELPVVGEKKGPKAVSLVAAVVCHGARVLLAKRRKDGLFGGMWEPPMVEARSLRGAREGLGALGIDAAALKLKKIGQVKHVLSHRALSIVVARADVGEVWDPEANDHASYEQMAFRDPEGGGFGISTLASKVLRAADR